MFFLARMYNDILGKTQANHQSGIGVPMDDYPVSPQFMKFLPLLLLSAIVYFVFLHKKKN